jgi:Ca2+-binding RTX toxin-like protein
VLMAHSRRSTRFASVTVICGVAVGLLAGTAFGSTAQFVDVVIPSECKYVPPGFTCLPGSAKVLVYRGGPGEANAVRVTGSGDAARIDDPAAVIDPGEGCSAIDAHSVSCAAPEVGGVYRVYVSTGSGADTISSSLPGPVIVDGGPGDDVLLGGPSGDVLYGGSGADALRGGDGADGLYDASPREPLRSGDLDPYLEETVVALADPGRGRDSFDGGRGRDGVSYDGRSAGVRVDLVDTAAIGGARGEHDSVKSVQNAVGGGGDDRLAGNKRSNTLDGAGGDDRIVAGRGNDYIEGGTGRNVIIAGPGDDLINSLYRPSDYGAERTFCGPGLDHVSWTFPSDFVNDDCEALEFNFLREGGLFGGDVRSQLPLRKGGAHLVLVAPELWCYFVANPSGCGLRLDLLVDGPASRRGTAPPRGTLLGSQSYTFSPNERKSVSLSVSQAGLRMLRRHRALSVRVRVTEDAPHQPGGYLTVLRTP